MTGAVDAFAPGPGEAGVLSLLAVRQGQEWRVVAGSLLAMCAPAAVTSWPEWERRQPATRPPYRPTYGQPLDLGPQFQVSPFPGLLAVRQVVRRADWPTIAEDVVAGSFRSGLTRFAMPTSDWSPTGILGAQAHSFSGVQSLVAGAQRPVLGIGAVLDAPPIPHTEPTFSLQLQPGLERGRDLARMSAARSILHWPDALLGIGWLADDDHAPQPGFVIGRAIDLAWINKARPINDEREPEVAVEICWHADRIDPLGCTLITRAERNGVPLLVQSIRISDLPGSNDGTTEPRHLAWDQRVLTARVPRGPTGTAWGASLISQEGLLLDEMPTAQRVESIHLTISAMGSTEPGSTSISGNPYPAPVGHEISEAVTAAQKALGLARDAATARRVSTLAGLGDYLRWRLSCRSGELLLLDPQLLNGDAATVVATIAFLRSLGRPIRALCRSVPDVAFLFDLTARRLPHGVKSLHDRVWLVGDAGFLVGGSPSTFMSSQPGATTVTELPHADTEWWRQQFEAWWP